MTSKIKVNILADGGDNSIITSDGAGSFTASSSLASSVQSVGGIQMTPSFEAKMSANQGATNNANTKVQFNTENFDTDGNYDTSNYRFLPTTAGKYFIYASVYLDSGTNSQFENGDVSIRLNGSAVKEELKKMENSYIKGMSISTNKILDLNGTSDYVEVYARCFDNSGNPNFLAGAFSIFGGYKLIGA